MNKDTLYFVIFCVSGLAERLGTSAREAYHRLKDCGAIGQYIVPCYDVLHTFSKDYIIDDLILYMEKKGGGAK